MTPPQATTLDQAQQVINEMAETIAQQERQIEWFKRQLFSSRSERLRGERDNGPGLFDDVTPAEVAAAAEPTSAEEPADDEGEAPRRRRRGKRKPIPDHLPREDRIHDLPESEKAGLVKIGEEVSEQLAIIPGQVYVIRHIRYRYARIEQCLDGSEPNVITADRPVEGLPRCIADPSLLSFIVTGKFTDHLPLYRQQDMLERNGVSVPRSSMCRWVIELAVLCRLLLVLMKDRVLQSRVILADETPVRQQVGAGGHGPRGPTKRCYFYSYVGDEDHPYIIYDYQQTRGREGPNGWFTDDNGDPNYHGLLVCDGYAGYGELFNPHGQWQMMHVGCWAHARRKFYDIRTQFPGPCHDVLGRIRSLYAIEREAQALSPEDRQVMRDERSRPIVEELLAWCSEQNNQVLPRSGLGEAIGYMLGQADALRRYLDDGHLPIDNNACERSLRGIAIGRKNWLFTGSEAGGRAAAAMFTLIASARRHGLDPQAYLTDVFTRLPATPISQLHQFLPDQWQPPAN